jgi:hypothetical protein
MRAGVTGSRQPPQGEAQDGKIDRKGFGFHGLVMELVRACTNENARANTTKINPTIRMTRPPYVKIRR